MIHGARYLLNGNAPMRGHDCAPIRGALVVIIQAHHFFDLFKLWTYETFLEDL